MKLQRVWAVVLIVLATGSVLFAQTQGPTPIKTSRTVAMQDTFDLFYSDAPGFAIGWNWGASMLGTNTDFHMNIFHAWFPFTWGYPAWPFPPQHVMQALPDAVKFVMVPSRLIHEARYATEFPWYDTVYHLDPPSSRGPLGVGNNSVQSLSEGMGFRFHPELSMADTIGFTPRASDTQGAIWGFLDKNLTVGSIPSSTADENYSRYKLSKTGVSSWTSVLNNSWPQQQFCEWDKGLGSNTMRPFNGREQYLAINLRRSDALDTLMNQDSVLRIRIHYATCNDDTTIREIRFDSLPDPDSINIALPLQLPDGIKTTAQRRRGMVHPLIDRPGSGAVEEIVITRQMLPRGDATERDVTVMAHFKAMYDRFATNTSDQNPHFRNRWYIDKAITYDEAAAIDSVNMRISRMWIEVEYRGNSDVAIDWVQIGTDNVTRFLQGYYDEENANQADTIVQMMTRYNREKYAGTGGATSPNRHRLWRWYNRDEPSTAYWLGLAYMHKLFDNRTLDECEILPTALRKLHHTGMAEHWEGTTPRFNESSIAAPYKYGHLHKSSPPNRSDYYLGVRAGVADVTYNGLLPMDYDLYYGREDSVSPGVYSTKLPPVVPFPSVPATTPGTNGYVPTYPDGIESGQGLQASYEQQRYKLMQRNVLSKYLFHGEVPWYASIWFCGDLANTTFNSPSGTIRLSSSSARIHTGEEVSLMVWSQIILGTKGMFLWWGANTDSVTQRQEYTNNGFISHGLGYGIVNPTIKRYIYDTDSSKWLPASSSPMYRDPLLSPAANELLANTRTQFLHDQPARSAAMGPDWLTSDNCMGMWQLYKYDCTPNLDTVVSKLYGSSDTTKRWYLGMQSARAVLQDVFDVANRGESDLAALKLKAWYSRGFRTWKQEAVANTFIKYVQLDSIKSRHPHRDPISRYPTWESKDSSFLEATLLQFGADSTMLDSFAIGVLNRRCNPYYIDSVAGAPTIDYNTFPTYYDHWAATNVASDKSKRYRQSGARTIRIPFVYTKGDFIYRYLRIQEIGGARDSAQGTMPIDTVIGQDKDLELTLLPGEGKMLKVTVLPPNTPLDSLGYLTHSNQRKLVVFPTLQSPYVVLDTVNIDTTKMVVQRMVLGDSLRYHVVYHRRKFNDSTLTINPLTVYYRRSVAYRRELDTVFTRQSKDVDMVPNLVWEAEIPVSEVLYRNEAMGMHPGFDSIYNRSCAYPALVVRPDAVGLLGENSVHGSGAAPIGPRGSVVYIVYGCADTALAYGDPPIKMYFAETQIRADVPHAQQVADAKWYGGRILHAEEVIDDADPDNRPLMYKWATPTINAASQGNWYAWPAPNSDGPGGIRIMHKFPNTVHTQAMYYNLLPKGDNAETWYATHPSLNTYSRLDLGERDAALVWQEGESTEDGDVIRYTRLRRNATTALPEWFFNNGGSSTLLSVSLPTNLILNADSTIAELTSQARFPTSQHRYPVIFRHLSDFDLDTTDSRYNLGLVHHKAERIWFETKPTAATNWRLCRYMVDISDYTAINHANPALNNADTLFANPPSFLVHNVNSLFQPDIAQGHQRTEMLPSAPAWIDDSAMVVNFTLMNSKQPIVQQLIFGYRYYMNTGNHTLASLPATQMDVQSLNTTSIYSHLAARFSTSRFKGWQQNRRVFSDNRITYWDESVKAPELTMSAMHFFKESERLQSDTSTDGNGQPLQAINLRGVAAGAGELLTGEFVLQNTNEPIEKMSIEFTNDIEFYGTEQGNTKPSLITDWFNLPFMSTLAVPVQIKGDASIATLGIERESDGYIFELTALELETEEPNETRYMNASFVADVNERYRFRLTPNDSTAELQYAEAGRTYPVNDVWLREAGEDGLQESGSYKQGGANNTLIDLRRMTHVNTQNEVLLAYPTPAQDVVNLLVLQTASASQEKMSLSYYSELIVTDMLGNIIHKQQVQNRDLVTLNVAAWAEGMYAVSLINSAQTVQRKSTVVRTVTIPIVR